VDEVIDLVEEQRHLLNQQGGASPAQSPRSARSQTGSEKAEVEVLRLLLANHPSVRGLDWSTLFSVPDHLAAYDVIAPTLAAMDPGEPPDLGSLVGNAEPAIGEMLGRLALDDRPLPDAEEVVKKVQVGALEGRVRDLQFQVGAIDADTEPEAYSVAFRELIALEKQRRELWSHE
jgi:hypothetical protein